MSNKAAKPSENTRPRKRPRWVRVRIETDEETLIGTIRLESASSSLYDLLDDERSYLAFWSEHKAGSQDGEQFLALHKSAIRSVALDVPTAAESERVPG